MNSWIANRLVELENDPVFQTEELVYKINEQLCGLMEEHGISRTELARRLGVERQYVTKVLNGLPNLTLLSLVKIATALDSRVEVGVLAKQANQKRLRKHSNWNFSKPVDLAPSRLHYGGDPSAGGVTNEIALAA